MLIAKPLSFAVSYLDAISDAIQEIKPDKKLTQIQRYWLGFCIMGILITNSVCWARFERAGAGKYTVAALSWMFHHSGIPWDLLLHMSVRVILRRYGITKGVITIDDTENKRSKRTKLIPWVHKIKDKASGGFVMGQSLVFLVLATPKITIPVGFSFHMPDPAYTAWKKQDERLKKLGIPASKRPPRPPKNDKYPTIPEIALILLAQFRHYHPEIRIKCVVADALYGTDYFLTKASNIFGGVQVISQIRINQKVRFKNKELSVEQYFLKHPGVPQQILIRGGEKITVYVNSARLYVNAHGKKRFVIALKYEGEKEYRYLVASDMSWRTMDIVQAYTLRWLVEVFIQDWKSNEGWVKLTKLPGKDGSSRGLILSLLVDHCLFFHPEQAARIENNLPACTVGSLRNQVKVESLLAFISEYLDLNAHGSRLDEMVELLKKNACPLEPSKKHMVGRDLGRLDPSPSLRYKNALV